MKKRENILICNDTAGQKCYYYNTGCQCILSQSVPQTSGKAWLTSGTVGVVIYALMKNWTVMSGSLSPLLFVLISTAIGVAGAAFLLKKGIRQGAPGAEKQESLSPEEINRCFTLGQKQLRQGKGLIALTLGCALASILLLVTTAPNSLLLFFCNALCVMVTLLLWKIQIPEGRIQLQQQYKKGRLTINPLEQTKGE